MAFKQPQTHNQNINIFLHRFRPFFGGLFISTSFTRNKRPKSSLSGERKRAFFFLSWHRKKKEEFSVLITLYGRNLLCVFFLSTWVTNGWGRPIQQKIDWENGNIISLRNILYATTTTPNLHIHWKSVESEVRKTISKQNHLQPFTTATTTNCDSSSSSTVTNKTKIEQSKPKTSIKLTMEMKFWEHAPLLLELSQQFFSPSIRAKMWYSRAFGRRLWLKFIDDYFLLILFSS